MKKIVLVWELGAGLGHLSTFLPVVKNLKKSGYQPFLVLKDISRMELIYHDEQVEYIQGPSWSVPRQTKQPQINFTDSLFHFGYLEPQGLMAMVKGWQNLFDIIKPDLLFFDYAPTALLAARGLNVPKIIFGNCFSIPPVKSPLPPFAFWLDHASERERLVRQERLCVNNVNSVLEYFDLPVIDEVHEIYSADHYFLTTDPQLDIYGQRDSIDYLGAISTNEIGEDNVVWPLSDKTKIFVYIKYSYKYIEQLLLAIISSDAQYIIYCADLPETKKKQYQADNVLFVDSPCNINAVRKESYAAIIHGGNLMDKFLEVGQPLLLVPMQMENLMMAKTALKHNAVLSFNGDDSTKLNKMIDQLIKNSVLKYNAMTLSSRMLRLDQSTQMQKIISKVDMLLGEN